MKFKIISLNIGKISQLESKSGPVKSAYGKSPVERAQLGTGGFDQDEQADLKHHGGSDKAVCVYSAHHFSSYEELLDIDKMPIPAFGENFTVDFLAESELFIGDVFSCGEIRLQITQPRQPCSKSGLFHKNNKVIKFMSEQGSTGFYFRVLNGGAVNNNDVFERVETNGLHSLQYANDIMYRRNSDQQCLREFIANPDLSQAWKDELSARLK